MSILERTKHCTRRFPCRFRLVMIVFSFAVVASIAAVSVISGMA